MKTPSFLTGKIRWIALAVAVIAIGGLLTFWLLRDRGDPDVLRLYGNVDIREVELSFRQPGRMLSMAFDEGDTVTAGAVLAQLDATPYREKLAAAEAELRAAQAGRDKLRSGNRPQEIAQVQERVRQAQAASSEAERNFTRQNTLLESGASSQRTADAARTMRDQAAADMASAKAGGYRRRRGARSGGRSSTGTDAHRAGRHRTCSAQRRYRDCAGARTRQHGGEQHARVHPESA